jgi:hypothetical protein
MKINLNSLGVICASIGAFLVWRYLTELNFSDKEAYLRGEGILTVPDPSALDIRRFKRSVALSKAGLILILIGGLLQVVSNYLPEN